MTAVFETPQSSVHGANFTWANTGATFSTGANWLNGTAPSNSATLDVGVFLGTPTVQPQVTATRSIGGLDFQTVGWTFTGTGELALGSGVGTAEPFTAPVNGIISSTNALGSINFNNPIKFSNNQTWASSLDVDFNSTLNMDGAGTTRSLFFGSATGTSFAGSLTVNGNADFNSSLSGGAPTRLVTFGGIGNVTMNGTLKETFGPVSIRMNDTGVLSLLGSNTYTGSTTFSSGTLVIATDASLGVAPATLVPTQIGVTGSSAMQLSPAAGSISLAATRGINISTTGTFTIDTNGAANTLVIPGPIAGTGRLFKQGAGTLVLSGPNTQTGTLAFVGGVLDIQSNNSTGSGIFRFGGGTLVAGAGPVTISNPTVLLTNASTVAGSQPITFGGIFTYDGTTDRSETINNTALTTITGGWIISSSQTSSTPGVPRRMSLNGTGNTTIVGPITETPGVPGVFIINNTGSTTLLSTSNSYTGGFQLGNTASTVIIPSDNALGTGTFTWIGGTIQSPTPRTIANPISMIPTGTRGIGSNMTFSGPVVLSSPGLSFATDRTVSVGTLVTGTFSGNISDTDGTGFEKAGAGTLVLTGSNTYSGGTSLRGGALSVASDTNLGAAAGSTSFDGGTLLTTAGITSTRAITTVSGGAIDTSGFNDTFGAVSGTGVLTKAGSGMLTLDGVRGAGLPFAPARWQSHRDEAPPKPVSSMRCHSPARPVRGLQLWIWAATIWSSITIRWSGVRYQRLSHRLSADTTTARGPARASAVRRQPAMPARHSASAKPRRWALPVSPARPALMVRLYW